MALTYNLKYRKQNFFNKVLLEKEGEIILDRHSLRLKGKGARDHGENIFFADMKELLVSKDEQEFTFITFKKEKYILSNFLNLFEAFLKDFYRVRNDFLAESLFMKVGMLYHEYDGQIEVTNRFGKIFQKGKSRLQVYEGSMVVFPEKSDCFAVFYNFLKNHECDEDDYLITLQTDTGSSVQISKLGTSFGDFKETLESLLGKMYEKIVNNLQEILPDFDAGTLLKLASVLREGKLVQIGILKKIHEDLPQKLQALTLQNCPGVMMEKLKILREITDDQYFYLGICCYSRTDSRDLQVRSWFALGLPQQNLLALGMTSNPRDHYLYFFQILAQHGDFSENLAEKINEINQSMYLFRYDFGPMYRDKHELKNTKYRTALRKSTFLRLLRRSYIGKSTNPDAAALQGEIERFAGRAKIATIPVPAF